MVLALVPLPDEIKIVSYEQLTICPYDLLVLAFVVLSKDEAKTENPQYAKPEPSERRDSHFHKISCKNETLSNLSFESWLKNNIHKIALMDFLTQKKANF